MQLPRQRGRVALPPVLALVLTVSLVAVWTDAAARASSTGAVVERPTQELALLLRPHVARSGPDEHSVALQRVSVWRPLTAERTALPVLGHWTGADGAHWLHVLLPGRPNGHSGWIDKRATASTITIWRIRVETTNRRVTVYRKGHPVRTFRAVVGKPSTPTPHGEFFVEESLQLRPGDVGAPFALALSARSEVLQEFDGGPGQIALHGLTNVGGVLGTAVSHGCVRLGNDAMRWLATRISPGVPVTITN